VANIPSHPDRNIGIFRDVDTFSEQVYGLPPRNIRSSSVMPMTKRYDDPIEVEVEYTQVEEVEDCQPQLTPSAFSWRGRRYAVAVVLKYWRRRGGLGSAAGEGPRVLQGRAEGGVYDLRFDRTAGPKAQQWRLARVWD